MDGLLAFSFIIRAAANAILEMSLVHRLLYFHARNVWMIVRRSMLGQQLKKMQEKKKVGKTRFWQFASGWPEEDHPFSPYFFLRRPCSRGRGRDRRCARALSPPRPIYGTPSAYFSMPKKPYKVLPASSTDFLQFSGLCKKRWRVAGRLAASSFQSCGSFQLPKMLQQHRKWKITFKVELTCQ